MLSVERLIEWGYTRELAELVMEAELMGAEYGEPDDETDDEERYYYDSL